MWHSHNILHLHQRSGISNQAVLIVFVSDVKIYASQTYILPKSAIFYNTPAENGMGKDFSHSGNWFEDHNFSNMDT